MAQNLKQSVLEQLHLPELQFTVDLSGVDPAYSQFLQIKVKEVYGSSALPKEGDSYLICGNYELKEHEQVRLFAAAADSTSTGVEALLQPGSGEFATSLRVERATEPRRPILALMIDSDTNRVIIHLQE